LKTLDPAMRRRVLRAAARQLGARLSFEETARLLALAGFVPHPTVTPRNGATLELAQQLRAERSLRELRLSREPL
jgi:tRNA(Ile)-lysidine synthase